ncbi:unnamed protein product [Paramecium octaurelia]|uniref:Ribosome assembly factor mrt4 n=1 Tax=Paramecium octaurelia TaxID=43137 RepID=A0A8S1VKM3_PAROT|nr:unnamed protein product [Paramecium octaurelia]
MPITKRKKTQVLTKTKKKTPEKKELLVKKLKQSLKKYQRAIVFQYKNLSTNPLKEIQQAWKSDSKLFIGKNKVMQVGLGKGEEQSATKNSYLLSPFLKGETGLLLTNKTLQEIQDYCDTYKIPEFARAGHISDQTIVLKEGIDTLKGFAHSIEPYLRKLGLNTQLINQQIVLNEKFILAQEGKPLTVEQTKILRLMNQKLAYLEIAPLCVLEKNGTFKKL